MLKHLDITLFGTVQGVFLRRTVAHEANRLGIRGFVRNDPDGTVRIEAEGLEEVLRGFVEWLKAGAGEGDYKISRVEVESGKFQASDSFSILQ
jgi:acylphosphatase